MKKNEHKRNTGEPITKEEEDVFNRRHALYPYITNIKALKASQAVIDKGFQVSRHLYKMIRYGKYGKLSIDIPQFVEMHRLMVKENGVILLDEKVDSDFIGLISKKFNAKKKYSDLAQDVVKRLSNL